MFTVYYAWMSYTLKTRIGNNCMACHREKNV